METRYMTLTSEVSESKSKFDSKLTGFVKEGWKISGDIQASQYQGGSFLGYTSDTIISILLVRDFSSEEIMAEKRKAAYKKEKQALESKQERPVQTGLAIFVITFWLIFLIAINLK